VTVKTPPGVRPARLERKPVPALATLVDAAPEGDAWLHELKFDGYRLLARVEGSHVKLLTRNGNDWTDRMPGLSNALGSLRAETAVVDGELVVLDADGVSDFQLLQNSLDQSSAAPLVYYAFDLLYCEGEDWRGAACVDRKARLAKLLSTLSRSAKRVIRLSEHVTGHGDEFFRKACEAKLEGIISKRAAAPYRPGRGRDWLKVKCMQRQEFVIVGYSDPGGARRHLGALLLGVQKQGQLVYAGRVGTGFSDRSLAELLRKLAPLALAEPAVRGAPRGAPVRDVHWVRPELVAEVSFTGFTQDGRLRHPAFRGLREDKSAAEVFPEAPVATPERAVKRRKRSAARK
jgi:bifunctional non-homologous end joining protein LigD